MNQPALELQEASPESLHALAGQYVARHCGVENWVFYFSIEFWLLRRIGLKPLSWPGRLVGGLVWVLMILLPALILTAITGQWADAPLLSWTMFAVVMVAAAIVTPPLYRSAIGNELSWLWAIADEADLQRLIAWEGRWYSHRVMVPVSGALTLGTVLPFYFLALHGSGAPLPAGTLYIAVFLVFLYMQGFWGEFMMAPEAYNLSTCKYELYLLSPADSVAVRQSLRGYNQIGALNVVMMTFLILLLVILLPGGSGVVAPVVLALLLVSYVCTALGTLIPRFLMGRMIQSKKEEEMQLLQVQLNDLLPRIRQLTEEEYKEMTRLQETHDAIRDSPENLLPLGAILRTVGALILSTATVLVTAFAQEWIAGLVKRLVP